jgi:VIT1/CCC1 family predicted Fe2+/Mn2+ transporter
MLDPERFIDLFKRENTHFCIYKKLLAHEKDKKLKKRLERMIFLEKKHMAVWKDLASYCGSTPEQEDYKFFPFAFLLTRQLFGKGVTYSVLDAYETSSVSALLNIISIVPASRLKGVVDVITDELYNENLIETTEKIGLLPHVREIVFGMNDGLVEVLASVSGLVGIYKSNLLSALAGLIVGISGTISMAVGAYLSSTSERDISLSKVNRMQLEIEAAKERASKELGNNYKSYALLEKGLDNLIKKLKNKNDPFYKLLEKEKKTPLFRLFNGSYKSEDGWAKGSSPLRDSAYVGIFYLLGAIIPLISFFIGIIINDSVYLNLAIAVIATSVAVVITAALIAANTNESTIKRVSQSLALNLGAAGVTFVIGLIVSVYLHIAI